MQKTIHSNEHTALRNLLTAKRQDCALTQAALADRLGMPQSFISKVERGERLLDVVEFARYISTLGVDPVEAFSELMLAIKLPTGTAKTKSSKKRARA